MAFEAHSKDLVNSVSWKNAHRLLCLLLRNKPVEQQELIDFCTTKELNWEHFKTQLEWHRIATLVWARLKTLQDLVPREIIDFAERENRTTRLRNLQLTSTLLQINSHLKSHDIPFLCLKGPALSQRLYGDPCCRFSKDLDVLVDKKDVHKTMGMLAEIGFSSEAYQQNLKNRNLMRQMFESSKDITLVNSNLESIELHWRWETNWQLFPLPFKPAWDSRSEVQINSHSIPVLNDSFEFLYLAMHGAKSHWARLSWLSDIDRMCCQDYHNRAELHEYSAKLGATLMVCLALEMVRRLMSAEHKFADAVECKGVNELAKVEQKCNQTGEYLGLFSKLMYVLELKRSIHYKVATCLTFLFLAGREDILAFPLPQKLYFFYYLIRPFSIAIRQSAIGIHNFMAR